MLAEKERRRKPRRDRGPRLTPRDLVLLRWMGEQYALRFDQIQQLLARFSTGATLTPGRVSESTARHTIDRWEIAGLVVYKKILADEPGYCWVTPAGLRTAGLPFRAFVPQPSNLRHLFWCVQARLALTARYPTWSWRSERWLRTELDQRIKSVKLPDALLVAEDGRTIAVEVELTQKNSIKLEEIMKARTLVYAQTVYFAPPAIARVLSRIRDQLDDIDARKVVIQLLEENETHENPFQPGAAAPV
jgi:hypothetical protein